MSNDDQVMTDVEAADFLKITPSALAKMRRKHRQGAGPKFSRVGKSARYLRSDLIAFLNKNKQG